MERRNTSDTGFIRSILDAIPHPVFVVDRDVRIVEYNRAASVLPSGAQKIINQRGGDALNCVNAAASPAGCGSSSDCKTCQLRNSVNMAFQGQKLSRSKIKMEIVSENKVTESYLLVTTASFLYRGNTYALLTLEDINELIALTNLVSICSNCKKIRESKEYWVRLESYFKKTLDLNFSHGICPECSKILYPELQG